jgi:hypothetical protein
MKLTLKIFAGIFLLSVTSLLMSCGGGDKKDNANSDSTKGITKDAKNEIPGTLDGAKQLVAQFLDKKANYETLTKNLTPTMEDAKAIFQKEADAKTAYDFMADFYKKILDKKQYIQPNPGQDDYFVVPATGKELKKKKWKGEIYDYFPGGYHKVGEMLKDDATIYLFKFVKKGEKDGMRFEGLTFVNNHWVMFPKVWRAFESK